MIESKRLHPMAAVINFVKGLKDALFPIIVIFFLNGNADSGSMNWISLTITGLFLLLVLVSGIVRWLRYSYRIEEGELRMEYGLLFRKKRYIPIERIQSLNASAGILHRPFHLVKISIETAGNEKGEAELTAIKRSEAENLERVIAQVKQLDREQWEEESSEEKSEERHKVFEMSMKDIVLMAVTSGGAGVVLSGVGVFFTQSMDVLPLGAIYKEIVDWIQIGVLVVAFSVFVVLLIAYGISILLTVLRYADFTVYLDEEDLVITRGLLEKKQITIPKNRIQGIRMDENLIRQPFGYATITLISAGGSGQKESEQQMLLLPFIKKKDVPELMEDVLSAYTYNVKLHKLPKRSLLRYVIRYSGLAWLVSLVLCIFFWPYGLVALLVSAILTTLGWLTYQDAGWNLHGRQLTLRQRSMVKRTYILKRHRIQSASTLQTIFQRRARLHNVNVTMKSGAGGTQARCLYMDEGDGTAIMEWYRPNQE